MQTPIQQEFQTKMERLARAKNKEQRRMERWSTFWLLVVAMICTAAMCALPVIAGMQP